MLSEHRHAKTVLGMVDALGGGLWRWFRGGYKPYLLVALSLTATSVALRAWWLTARSNEEQREDSVQHLLLAQTEPDRRVERSALLSAALELGYVDRSFDCLDRASPGSHEHPVCRDVRASLDWFELVAEAFALEPGPEAPVRVDDRVRSGRPTPSSGPGEGEGPDGAAVVTDPADGEHAEAVSAEGAEDDDTEGSEGIGGRALNGGEAAVERPDDASAAANSSRESQYPDAGESSASARERQRDLMRRIGPAVARVSTAPRTAERTVQEALERRLGGEGATPLHFESCHDPLGRRRVPGYAPAACVSSDPAVLVPSFVLRGGHPIRGRERVPSEVFEREQKSAELAVLLSPLVAASRLFADRPADTEPGSLPPRIVQSFFISHEGVLAVWNERDERPFDVFGSLIDLRGQYYQRVFADAPEARRRYSTQPYVDRGGFGLVRTACAPSRTDTGRLLGVFCVDYLMPMRLASRNRGLVNHTLVRARVESSDDPILVPLGETGDFSRKDLGALDRTLRETASGPYRWRSLVKIRHLDERNLFAVPLRRDGRTLYFLLVRPAERPRNLWLYILVGLALWTAVATVWALLSRRHARETENEDAVLRNLQVGTIRSSQDNRIIMANDRAEELIGLPLPGIGDADESEGVDIRSLFEFQVFEAQLGTRELRVRTLDEVQETRREGEESRYFVRKKYPSLGLPRGAWLEVHGSPELHVDERAGTDFGIVTVPSERRQAQLDREWEELGGGAV